MQILDSIHKQFSEGYEIWHKQNDFAIKGRKRNESEPSFFNCFRSPFADMWMRTPMVGNLSELEVSYRLAGYRPFPTGGANFERAALVKYADGRHEEGSFGVFSGRVYHGTSDFLFFTGKRFLSPNSREHKDQKCLSPYVFSVTTKRSMAEEFAGDFGMVIEYKVTDMEFYRIGRHEYVYSVIDLNTDDLDAVAIPMFSENRYREHEFAILNSGRRFMEPIAVWLIHRRFMKPKIKTEWKRYPIEAHRARKNPWSYLMPWLEDLFGRGFSDLCKKFCSPDYRGRWTDFHTLTYQGLYVGYEVNRKGHTRPGIPFGFSFRSNKRHSYDSVRSFREKKLS